MPVRAHIGLFVLISTFYFSPLPHQREGSIVGDAGGGELKRQTNDGRMTILTPTEPASGN